MAIDHTQLVKCRKRSKNALFATISSITFRLLGNFQVAILEWNIVNMLVALPYFRLNESEFSKPQR